MPKRKRILEAAEKKKKVKKNDYKELNVLVRGITQSEWLLYILISRNGKKTYCGITNNFVKRLRQHCQLIKGGARYTKFVTDAKDTKELPWTPVVLVGGWNDGGTQVRRVEYMIHKCRKRRDFRKYHRALATGPSETRELAYISAGIVYRLLTLTFFLQKEISEGSEDNVTVTWIQQKYRLPALWKDLSKKVHETTSSLHLFDFIVQEHQSRDAT